MFTNLHRRHPLIFLYLTIFINIMGFSMVFPLLPYYAEQFEASNFQIGLFVASHALASFLASPLVGTLSDKIGRKPVLIIGLLGGSCSMLLMAFADSLLLLFVGRIVHGLVSAAILPTAHAYVTDVTEPDQRILKLGKLGAALSAGLLIGPAVSSLLVGFGNLQYPFFAAAAIAFINAVSVDLFLQEHPRRVIRHLNLRKGYTELFSVFHHLRSEAGLLFLILFILSFVLSNNQVAMPLLAQDKFQVGADTIGYFFTAVALVSVLIQGFFLKQILKLVGEKGVILCGLLTMAIALILMPFVPNTALMISSFMVVGMGSSMNRPTTEGLVSRISSNGQGMTMGLTQSFESLGRVFGPLVGGSLYSQVIQFWPFVVSAILICILSLFTLRYLEIPLEDREDI